MLKKLMQSLLVLSFAATSCGFKILVYNPKFGHSHSNFMGRIADILVEAGHDVTSLIPEIWPEVADGTKKSTRIIRLPQDERVREARARGAVARVDYWRTEFDLQSAQMIRSRLNSMFCPQCEATIRHPGLLEELRQNNYDLLIYESYDYCALGLSHFVGIKATIAVSTTTLFDNVAFDLGIPVLPSCNPSFSTMRLDSSIWSRALNVFQTHLVKVRWDGALECADEIFQREFPNFPGMRKLTSEAAFVFTNSEPLIDFARPLLRKVVDLGGIGIQKPKPLDKSWDAILNRRSLNVLVSFGSMVKSAQMPSSLKHSLVELFTTYPNVTFMWKYEDPKDEFATSLLASLDNVLLIKWTPQNDLLGDGRVTGFISHGGMSSCQEAAARGVPGIFIPLFGDQPRNAAMMEYNGIGLVLDKREADQPKRLSETFDRLLTTKSLYVNAKKTSRMLSRRPFSPRELLVKHVEFAAEFGSAKSLTPRGLQLGWIQYFLVDVITAALLALTLAVIVAFFICRSVLRSIITRMFEDE